MRPLLFVFATLFLLCSPHLSQATAQPAAQTDSTALPLHSNALSSATSAHSSRSSRCERNPLRCIGDAILEGIIAPFIGTLLADAFSEARVATTLGNNPAGAVRLGRTFHYESAYGPLVFPYVGIGVHAQQDDAGFSRLYASSATFLESVVGLRTPLDTWHPDSPAWVERLHFSTEARWLHNSSTGDQFWIEAAPGLTFSEGRPTYRLHLTAAVAVAGDPSISVRPGIGVELLW